MMPFPFFPGSFALISSICQAKFFELDDKTYFTFYEKYFTNCLRILALLVKKIYTQDIHTFIMPLYFL